MGRDARGRPKHAPPLTPATDGVKAKSTGTFLSEAEPAPDGALSNTHQSDS